MKRTHIMDALIGTWRNKVCTDPNFPAFLDACNVTGPARKLFLERVLEVIYTKEDNARILRVNVKDVNDPKPYDCDLDLDKETHHVDHDGRDRKVVVTTDGTKLIEKYSSDDGQKIMVHRGVDADGNMTTTTFCNGVSFKYEWVRY